MPEERFNKIVQACRDAYSKSSLFQTYFIIFHENNNAAFFTVSILIEMQHDGELKYFKDMAHYIKKKIEDEEKGTSGWHVIVGKSKWLKDYRHKLRLVLHI